MSGKPLILIVDDEIRIRKLVSDFLKTAGYGVLCADDGEKALELFFENNKSISLIVLDVMLPKIDGWSVLAEIRKKSDVLILMLTAKSEDADQLSSFKMGADDYVSKPFSPSVLVARIESLLRRNLKTGEKIVFGNVTIDMSSRLIFVNGDMVYFTPKEYELLLYLYTNKNIALSREKLLNAVWSYDYYGDVRTVDTHIKQIRAKLDKASENLQTVRGIGYRFVI